MPTQAHPWLSELVWIADQWKLLVVTNPWIAFRSVNTQAYICIYTYIYVFWARIVNASLQCKFQHFFVTSWLTLWAGMEKGSYRSWLPGHMYICIYTFTFVYAWMRGALVVVHAWMLGSKLSVLHHGGRKRRSRAALLNTGRAHSGLAHPGSAWSWVGQKHKTQAWRKN